MKVIRKDPGQPPVAAEIDNTLEALQEAVGGYIETVSFAEGLCIICNEEGRLMGLEPNGWFFGTHFVGTVLVAGVDGEEFRGLTDNEIRVLASYMEDEES